MHTMQLERKHVISALAVLGLILGILWWNRGYGEVSPRAYQYANALYSVCNQRASARLTQVEQMIADAHAAEQLSDSETRWLSDIVDDARAGEWDTASSRVRELMLAQVD